MLGLFGIFGGTMEATTSNPPTPSPEFLHLVPSDKKVDPAWLASLTARGKPEEFSGEDLRFIGMPVGGLFCGTVYLGGDGRLWLWDIFNDGREGVVPEGGHFKGKHVIARDGGAYVEPPIADQHRVLQQGFDLTVQVGGKTQRRTLDADPGTGFPKVTFRGEYPIGTITYEDEALPLAVKLEAFSPFIPLNVADSSLPATIFDFTIDNRSTDEAEITLSGHLENAVFRSNAEHRHHRRNDVKVGPDETVLSCSVALSPAESSHRADILFEDWSGETYAATGWSVEGRAFGSGPISKADLPAMQGEVGGDFDRLVNSFASAPGTTTQEKDAGTGRLVSRAFKIERRFVNLWISGGNFPGKVCVNLKVDGKVVQSATGANSNTLREAGLDARAYQGQSAVIEIVDEETLPWGSICLGPISFSDELVYPQRPENAADSGTMALALLGQAADVAQAGGEENGWIGTLGRKLRLAPADRASIRFVVAWHFPNVPNILNGRRRHYAARFKDAAAVVRFVAGEFQRLAGETRLWRDTWYDSTLPFWFLNRTFANTSILATTTCHRFDDGRFWAWEGVGSCAGTCTHVWHYAQAVGRLFPEIERDHRERVDFGLGFRNGIVRFRAESGFTFAVDGQAGRILGAYREHQMSTDDAFLRRIWPRVKEALSYIIRYDVHSDGILAGPLHNTLDADWFGIVPWLCGMYYAALRAGAVMAGELGDDAFARQCEAILRVGPGNLDARCWKPEFGYYIQTRDEAHAHEIGSYDGCHIDQVLGQGWAWQVGLGRVMTETHVREALASLWRFNFCPDVGPYRAVKTAGRWYATSGDAGLLMVTHPFGDDKAVTGAGAWTIGYFNECMSGFEHQVAGHMVWEGMVTEGLAITRAIHDRYRPQLRNPYNEIECSDHYARAMASYGTFLAAGGFSYHGPRRHLGFSPRLRPEHFRTAFTVAEGWGTYEQTAKAGKFLASIRLKWGRLLLSTLTLHLPGIEASARLQLAVDTVPIRGRIERSAADVTVVLDAELELLAGSTLSVQLLPPDGSTGLD